MADDIRTKMVSELKTDDRLDLEGDKFADVGEDALIGTWRFEYGRVDETVFETPTCIRVDFTNGISVGFPPEHLVVLADD